MSSVRLVMPLVFGTLLCCVGSAQQQSSSTLESALVPGCTVRFRSTLRVDEIRAWLDCGCGPVLITHPMNLLDRVRIKTPEQALSFVRLFSSRETFRYFSESNRVEVLPGEEDGPFVLDRKKFSRVATPLKVEAHRGMGGRMFFRVTRTTVSLDDLALEEIVETVDEDGYYKLVSSRVLAEDATQLGMRLG